MTQHVCLAVLLLFTGCAEEPPPTWEEFRSMVAFDVDTGVFLVDGEETLESESELRAYYDDYVAAPSEDEVEVDAQPLTVNRVGGRDDKWNRATAHALTYCVSKKSFGDRHDRVVQAMATAAAAWEAVADVKYTHHPDADDDCNGKAGVLFTVRQKHIPNHSAYAFFPSSRRKDREIFINPVVFGWKGPLTLAGILRHELGHTLGFRHEHLRSKKAPARCLRENNSWRPLTPYDSNSVMHYPECAGTNNGDLVLTQRDKQGAARLYPRP
jgi:hypothetical protein